MKIVLYVCEDELSAFAKQIRKEIIVYLCYAEERCNDFGEISTKNRIINVKELAELQFDYLLIMTHDIQQSREKVECLLKLGIEKKAILEYCFFEKNPKIHPVGVFYEKFADVKWDMFVFGMSHSYGGLKENLLKKKTYKFSAPSMDLYYHYTVLKDICENYDMTCIKQIVFELPYYIFNYDISLSYKNFIQRMNYYYFWGDYHHFGENELGKRHIYMFEKINSLCENNYETLPLNRKKEAIKNIRYFWLKRGCRKMRYSVIRKEKHIWSNVEKKRVCTLHPHVWYKKHEKTIEENKIVWEKIKQLLERYEWIDLKVIVFPFCSWFMSNHRGAISDMRELFYETIDIPKSKIVDCFAYYENKPEFFSDECHLNDLGAYRFTHVFDDYFK